MKKSILLIVLALVIAFGSLVACTTGRKENSTATPPASSSKEQSSSSVSSEISSVQSSSSLDSSSETPSSSSKQESSSSSVVSSQSSSVTSSSSKETFYQVTFNANNGSGQVPTIAEQKAGATFTIPTSELSRTEYTFGGWSYGGNIYKEGDTFTMPNSAVEFVAVWTRIAYGVNFDANGGSGTVPTIENQISGATFVIPTSNLTKANCILEGWIYNGITYKVGDTFTMPNKAVEFVAVWVEVYAVTFNLNEGTGVAPTIAKQKAGATFTIPTSTVSREWYKLEGWAYNGTTYKVGDTFTMPSGAVEFVAVWTSTMPGPVSFSQYSYSYNRIGGADLELPITLNGATIKYVKVDGVVIDSSSFYYNATKKTLAIKEDFALQLSDGEHTIKPITDAGLYAPTSCVVNCYNSIPTQLLGDSIANMVYGAQREVGFNFNFNGTSLKSLKINGASISSSYYRQSGNYFYINAEYLSKYLGEVVLTLRLSNNDVYTLKTYSNLIFTSDYDINTIHSTYASNIGHNPLYQYYDNVSIVNAPTQYGFSSGKVLKITPSTVEGVTYDCYGYLTLKGPSCPYMWYDIGYTSGKYYAISFDYATEGTSRGEFVFRTENSSWSQNLLLGPSNDGKVHHFSTILSGDTIGYGTILWAKFVNGGGNVYIDNIKIVELANTTSVVKTSDYSGDGAYTFTLNASGFVYDVYIDGVKVISPTLSGTTLSIPASVMQEIGVGYHTMTVDFMSHEQSFEFQRTTGGTVVLSTHEVGVAYNGAQVMIPATVTPGMHITRIKRAGTNHWDNTFTSAEKEGQLTNYSPNNGYLDVSYMHLETYGLILKPELINILYGTETLTIEFSNGQVEVIKVTSNSMFFTNWDDAYIHEEYSGNVSYCQDTSMVEFVKENGNTKLHYTPSNATLGHATNPNGDDNGVMTFANTYLNMQGWWPHNLGATGKVFVYFDYEVIAPNGSEGNFKFNYFTGGSGFSGTTSNDVDITGSGKFYIELNANTLNAFRIYAPMTTGKADNDGCSLIIDNFGFGILDGYTTKISGSFNTNLAIKSVQKLGNADWDATFDNEHPQDNYSADNGFVSASMVKIISSTQLAVSDKLLQECYVADNRGTVKGNTIIVTFSDNSTFSFELNKTQGVTNMFYTNYDTTTIYQVNEGNVESCQDTAMRTIVSGSLFGGNALKYEPSLAVQGHASYAGSYDNGVMTITNSRLNTQGWWQHDFGTTGTAYVGFNYKIVLGAGKANNFTFTWLEGGTNFANFTRNSYSLSATSGYFYMEMPVSKLNAFYIHCLMPSAGLSDNAGSYMIIDNYYFGVK